MLTGLGGPARLYQATWHIGTRPFYETPGAILAKATSFGARQHLRGAIKRSLRGLRIRPRAVLLLTCIPDKLRDAPDGNTARVTCWTPYPWRRYRTHCPGRRYTKILLTCIPDTLPRAAIHIEIAHMQTRRSRYRVPPLVYPCPRDVERSQSETQSERHEAR